MPANAKRKARRLKAGITDRGHIERALSQLYPKPRGTVIRTRFVSDAQAVAERQFAAANPGFKVTWDAGRPVVSKTYGGLMVTTSEAKPQRVIHGI